MIRSTFIDFNPVELNHYPFIISLNKCNVVMLLKTYLQNTKICIPSETKDVDVTVFNMITKINEAKTLVKHISCDCKCKFDSTTCNSSQKWNNETCQCKCKNCRTCKKDYICEPSTTICECNKSCANKCDKYYISTCHKHCTIKF